MSGVEIWELDRLTVPNCGHSKATQCSHHIWVRTGMLEPSQCLGATVHPLGAPGWALHTAWSCPPPLRRWDTMECHCILGGNQYANSVHNLGICCPELGLFPLRQSLQICSGHVSGGKLYGSTYAGWGIGPGDVRLRKILWLTTGTIKT